MQNALIIFVRNPELGKVKTRLAASIGEINALKVYEILLAHTFNIASELKCDKYIFYAGSVIENDRWKGVNMFKRPQQGVDLGSRMRNAFREVIDLNYDRVAIIGSDCYDITTQIIEEAFGKLSVNDVVIGPASDGGYYLIGMKAIHDSVFENKLWSSATVLSDTLDDFVRSKLSWSALPILNDVDEETDITFAY